MTLSVQQESFAKALASGMQPSEAYRQAYHTTRLKDETVHAKALALADAQKLRARVAELKAVPVDDQQLWSREQAVRILVSIAMMEDGKSAVQMSAVKELNAMHGFFAPPKHEVDMRVNVNVHFD